MASTQIYFNYPTYSKNLKDSNNYDNEDDYSDEDYSDYENEIEYSLQQQDKLERLSGISGKSSGSGSGSGSGSSLSTSPSKSTTKNTNTNKSSTKSSNKSSNNVSTKPTNIKSSNEVKSVIEILDEIEQKEQEPKHKKAEVEKSAKLTSEQVDEILKRETESNKKERLPSTSEVYNRIKWEFNNKIDNFTILYEDRFDGLISTPFKDFEYDIIPHHRIQQFKYLDSIIYSRKDRIYNFNEVYNN